MQGQLKNLFVGIGRMAVVFCFAFACMMPATAQKRQQEVVPDQDLPSLLFKKKKTAISDSIIEPVKLGKINLAGLPIVGYNPANGFLFGAALSGSTMLGDPKNTRWSSGLLNATITTKKQLIFIGRAGLAFSGNKFLLDLETRVLIFNQDTYGLGTQTGREGSMTFASPEPMTFNMIRFIGNGYRRISPNLYFGTGIGIEIHTKIVDKLLQVDSVPFNETAHFQYSTEHGFPLKRYSTNGLFVGFKWDSRDNIANPYTGWFAAVSTSFNTPILGSTRSSNIFNFDTRYYVNVQRRRPAHLVAFWLRGQFSSEGKIPYLSLPSTSWDTYNRTGRGFVQGRFRGPSMAYFETEYRFPFTRNGLLGGVAFVNFSTASGNGQRLLATVAPAAGFGVRIKLDKQSRANITIDYGRGVGGSSGIFFNLQEAF
jgi:hypothetical protein